MSSFIDRREFAKLIGLGGVVFASGLGNPSASGPFGIGAARAATAAEDFFFVQLSDTHWGFKGPPNPEAANTLKLAVEAVNALPQQPDFIVFTGDLTHSTDDVQERRKRMGEFRDIVKGLKTQNIRYMPGENDASLDKGAVYQEFFGPTHYTFDHKGVHFIAIDNVSDPTVAIGEEQLKWLGDDLGKRNPDAHIVVFAHRPLFDLYPEWDWATKDGKAAIDLLMPHKTVTVFYGHIHQEHHQATGHIIHHAATSLIFPFPPPGSPGKRTPVAWNAEKPFSGLGWREAMAETKMADYKLLQMPIKA